MIRPADFPPQAVPHVLDAIYDAIEQQRDPRAHAPLTNALIDGDVELRWRHVDPFELSFGRGIDTPNGVLAVGVTVAGRPLAVIEAIRLGIEADPDGTVIYAEPPTGQPEGQVFR